MGSGEKTIRAGELTSLLSSALGEEKSAEVVATAARACGAHGPRYSPEEAHTIFQELSKAAGLVGVVARFAVSRGDLDRLSIGPASSPGPASARAPISARTTAPTTSTLDLVPLLSPALGVEKAREATETVARKFGFDPAAMTREQALAVLDDLTDAEGIVGVVARFAKARYLLEAT